MCCTRRFLEKTVIVLVVILCTIILIGSIQSSFQVNLHISKNGDYNNDFSIKTTISYVNCVLLILSFILIIIGTRKKNHIFLLFSLILIVLSTIGIIMIYVFTLTMNLTNDIDFYLMMYGRYSTDEGFCNFIKIILQTLIIISIVLHFILMITLWMLFIDYRRSVRNDNQCINISYKNVENDELYVNNEEFNKV